MQKAALAERGFLRLDRSQMQQSFRGVASGVHYGTAERPDQP